MNNFSGNPVLGFAMAMQKELDNNEEKGGWQRCRNVYLFRRLKGEVRELEKAFKENLSTKKIISECADVGNFAMMIADNYKPE